MTEDVSDEYYARLVDEEALAAYLADHLGPVEEFAVQRHAEGHSNETLFVSWGGRELVVRRPPPGETAETAHDVLREYRVVDALQDTPVPVPNTVLACEDEAVIGDEFYVMDRLDGTVLRDEEPAAVSEPAHRRAVGEEMVDTLAAIHGVDYEAVGLGDFGHPEGFTERQVRRWSEQLTWAFDTTAEKREVPELYEVMEWLDDNAPTSHDHTLVHGDFKLDNVIFGGLDGSPVAPEIIGVLDWEMSTLGDPLTDLGWLLTYWRDPDDPDPHAPEFEVRLMEHPDYPTREELVDRYERTTGIEVTNLRFYRTLAVYKLAGLGEMFYARHLQGNADDPLYPKMEQQVPALAERALSIIEGKRPL
jgi:aminoglycoside phosphotransferase (APT) family kinase protein